MRYQFEQEMYLLYNDNNIIRWSMHNKNYNIFARASNLFVELNWYTFKIFFTKTQVIAFTK